MEKFVSIVTMSLISFLAFVVTLFLLVEITSTSTQQIPESEQVAKVTDISEVELSIERGKLPLFEEFPDDFSTSTPVLTESIKGTTRLLTPEEASALPWSADKVPVTSSVPKNTTMKLSYETIADPIGAGEIRAYVEASSGISLSAATVSYANQAEDEPLSAQVREGIVFSIDTKNEGFLLSSIEAGSQKIFITAATKFFINGRPISFASLDEADVVRVEGQGYNNVGEIMAELVVIIGKFEVVTSGS